MRTALQTAPRFPNPRQRGGILVESALVLAFLVLPLLMGLAYVGFNLIYALQVNQINRDAGHMYARGVDFSGDTAGLVNQAVIFQMAPNLQTTTSSGIETMILSEIEYIGPNSGAPGCANMNHAVFTQQITFGNSALFSSKYGTVAASSMVSGGSGNVANPTTDVTVRADGILALLPMTDGQVAYVAETYRSTTNITIPGFPSNPGVYARAIF
jgi:hypothetical protein